LASWEVHGLTEYKCAAIRTLKAYERKKGLRSAAKKGLRSAKEPFEVPKKAFEVPKKAASVVAVALHLRRVAVARPMAEYNMRSCGAIWPLRAITRY